MIFFNLHSSFEVAGLGLERGKETDHGELDQWGGKKMMLVSVRTIHQRPKMIRPISVPVSPFLSSLLYLLSPSVAYGMFISHL